MVEAQHASLPLHVAAVIDVNRWFMGRHNNSSDEPEGTLERQQSRANLAAQHELDGLADVRENEAEDDYEDAAARTEADRQRQPVKRRFGVSFTRISHRLPAITSYLPKFSRGSKSPRDDGADGQSDKPMQSAGQPAPALVPSDPIEQEVVISQAPTGTMVLPAAVMQFSSTPILSAAKPASEQ